MRVSFCRLLAALILLSSLATNGSLAGPSRDLVVIDVSGLERLRQSDLPVVWKGASFFLAEWTAAQQDVARSASVPFRVLRADLPEDRQLYLFELHDDEVPPPEWEGALLRQGRKIVLEMDRPEAEQWMAEGYHGVRVPALARGFKPVDTTLAFDCSLNPIVSDLLGRTDSPQWLDWIQKISGAEPVTIGGANTQIYTRFSSTMFSGAPQARGFDFLLQQLQDWHYAPASIEQDPFTGTGGQTWKNLVLTIPGQTTPGDLVLLTAHYDSISSTISSTSSQVAPGADDNGTGSAILFEAARLFRQFRFARTIKLIWFTGEEQGLIGSAAYVVDHPTSAILGVVNVDMASYDNNGDRCMEIHAGVLPESLDVGTCFDATLTAYSLGLSRDFLTTTATDRSDHASFWQVGTGAIEIAENFFNDNQPGGCVGIEANPNYHMPGDTMLGVSPTFGFDIAKAALATVAALAVPQGACFAGAPSVSATPAQSAVDLSWTPVAGAGEYRIRRSTQSCQGQWTEIGATPGTGWTDSTASTAVTHYYHVEAVAADGTCVSKMSNCASAVPTVHHAATAGVALQDSCATGGPGDGDGVADPGEVVTLPITLRNDGSADLTDISGTLASSNPGVFVTDSAAVWPDLAAGASAASLPDHVGFRVGNVACGTSLALDLDLAYAEGSNAMGLAIPAGPPALPLDERFSTPGAPAGWTVVDGGTGSGVARTWSMENPGQRALALPFAVPFAIVDSDFAGSGVTQDEQLITPLLDLSGCTTATLTFSNQFRRDSANLSEIADVDVSTNDGSSWTNVLRLQAASDGYAVPTSKTVSITTAIAPNPNAVRIRFHYYQAQNEFWWAIDNVQVQCGTPTCNVCAAIAEPPGEAGLAQPLTVERSAGQILFNWGAPDPSCGATEYSVYRGDLATLESAAYSHDTALTCGTASTSFSIAETDPRLGEADYYLVVAGNGAEEGSYGRATGSVERPVSAAACSVAQDLAACMP